MKDHLIGWAGLVAIVVAEHPHPVRRPAATPRVPEDPAVRARLRADDRAMVVEPPQDCEEPAPPWAVGDTVRFLGALREYRVKSVTGYTTSFDTGGWATNSELERVIPDRTTAVSSQQEPAWHSGQPPHDGRFVLIGSTLDEQGRAKVIAALAAGTRRATTFRAGHWLDVIGHPIARDDLDWYGCLPDADGWIKHTLGDVCPVLDGALVDLRYASGGSLMEVDPDYPRFWSAISHYRLSKG